MRGDAVDRAPTFPILLAPACELTGVPQGRFMTDARVMADTLLRARELCGFDGIYVSRDNWVYHQALGGELSFPEDDESFSTHPLLEKVQDFRRLRVPDPASAPGMTTLLEAARAVVEAAGDRCYVQANIDTGPFSLAAVLRGAQDFLVDISTEPAEDLRDLLEFCADVVIAYGRAMMATGVHGIQFGDSVSSLVSPRDYERFVLPWQEKAVEALSGRDCDLWIHICGSSEHVLPYLRGLPIQGFEVDARVPLSRARALLGDRITLKGNLDTTFLLQASAAEVEDACMRLLDQEGMDHGLILSPGCGVPRMTPLANLRAMVRACERHAEGRASGA
jgi:uroporphyrinogen decarboxylase